MAPYPFQDVVEQVSQDFLLPAMKHGVVSRRPFLLASDAQVNAAWNVHGVGIGYKVIGNVTTDQRAVRFHVIQKLPAAQLRAECILPPSVGDLPTDVIESPPALLGVVRTGRSLNISGQPTCGPTGGSATAEDRKCYRPLIAGVAIGHPDLDGEGTLGWFCRSTVAGEEQLRFLLSARHVLALFDGNHKGDPVWQPQIQGTSVGKVYRYTPLLTGDTNSNFADAAIGLLSEDRFQAEVLDIGRPSAPVAPAGNMKVIKRGAGTLVTHGVITDFPYQHVVKLNVPGDAICQFKNQIRIESVSDQNFVDGGDSGALLLREGDLAPVGLIFSQAENDGRIAFANPLSAVFDALQITLL